MADDPEPGKAPDALKAKVRQVGRPVSAEDIDGYGQLRAIADRSHRLRTIVKAWKDQQTQDRELRGEYARWLLVALAVQAVVVNVAFVLLGCGVLNVDPWTARAFILAVFGEIAALVLVVVRYLFVPPDESILRYLDERKPGGA